MKSVIAWFAQNGVAANLLMALIVILGVNALVNKIPIEVFPDIETDIVTISVPYRGATPAEVEEAVVVRIEEAIQDLEGIKEIRSSASEGSGSVSVEVEKGYEPREMLEDLKNRIDAINTFPDETERPRIRLFQHRREVITVTVAGNLSEHELRRMGEQVRDEMANLPGITQVELGGIRSYEISIEVSEATLQQYGLGFDDISRAVSRSSIDLSAGSIKTTEGEILLRTKGQAYYREDFEKIVLLSTEDGAHITLGEVAKINDGFEEDPLIVRFNGKPAVVIGVYRVGAQNAITVADQIKEYIQKAQGRMPPGVELSFWRDRSKIIKARLATLLNSAMFGGILVFVVLTLFLHFSLSIWVCLGIPISFLGSIAMMPVMGVTINILSLFAFILVLGIVVDDAIVTGENVFRHMQAGEESLQAAIRGTQAVAIPVTFGILTTMAAFLPLTGIEGRRGQFIAQIPLIVIPVLFFSLVESKLILPAHLSHMKTGRKRSELNFLSRFQRRFADGLERFVIIYYRPMLERALRRRYLTLSIFLGSFIVTWGLVQSGNVQYIPFPRIQSERATARLLMPLGTPIEVTAPHINRMEKAARQLQDKYRDAETGHSVVEDILTTIGGTGATRGGRPHMGEVVFSITPPEERQIDITSRDLVNEWRKMIGVVPGAQEQNFRAEIGRSGDPIDVQLTGPDFEILSLMADQIKEELTKYPGVFDIMDNFEDGKQEIKLAIKPEAENLGLTMSDLARQVRQAFYGDEAQRIPRGREEVRVMVRYTGEERRSLASLDTMRIRTPDGAEVPFSTVASATRGRGFSTIRRIDRNRTINVTGDVNKEWVDLDELRDKLSVYLDYIVLDYPGVYWTFEGEAREQRDSASSFIGGMIFVAFTLYGLMAIPFRSYIQPLIVMSVIPFGLVGAVLGHILMGLNLSFFSIFGMLALAGVVVNDSLVMVHFVNQGRKKNLSLLTAVRSAGVVRFRAILLTSLTTFAGLLPLIFEKSTQAQFLIPMAVSLGFGILFATVITLFLVPINYLILEDFKFLFSKIYGLRYHQEVHWEDPYEPESAGDQLLGAETENPSPANPS